MGKRHYRVVRDGYAGFEAQWRPWWWPFWAQCFGCNTAGTLERSLQTIERHKAEDEVVWPTPGPDGEVKG